MREEIRSRLEGLLRRLPEPALSGDDLRTARALEVLEQIGTGQARALLETIARGASGARRTQEAKGCVERLAKRPVRIP